MKIIVDSREDALYKLIQQELGTDSNITCSQEQLLLGDIIFKNAGDEETILFERKSHNDLNASLKDGRYNEQSLRLNSYGICNHKIVYLLEESGQSNRFSKSRILSANLLHSCIFSLMFYKGFSVLQTKSIQHTASMLVDFARKMEKDNTKPLYSFSDLGSNPISAVEYTQTIQKEKKANITPENIDVFMLSQIPNVSSLTAKVILDKYGTIFELTRAMYDDPTCLSSLSYITKTDKSRKLTTLVIQNIRAYLCKIDKQEKSIDMKEII